jgi:hypothetical protein
MVKKTMITFVLDSTLTGFVTTPYLPIQNHVAFAVAKS